MIEAMLAGLRIDGHAADGIENPSVIRVVDGVTMVIVIMRGRGRVVSMCHFPAAAARSG
jgi:hypothetical protein